MGLYGIPYPSFSLGGRSIDFSTIPAFYYLALTVAAAATAVFYAIIKSPAGRAMIAIRDDETLAESLGIPTWRYKLIVFTLSAAFAGVGGAVYAHYMTVVSPLVFQTYYSNTILIIVLGGGVGRVPGAIIGSLLFVGLSEALRITPELRMIIYGLVLLVLVFVFPKGIAPLLDQVVEAMCKWRLPKKTGDQHAN